MSRAWLNTERIKEAFTQAAEGALDEVGEKIASDARQRAPVRKVFAEPKGYRRKYRSLTHAEKIQAVARAHYYYTQVRPDTARRHRAVEHIVTSARVQLRRPGSANALSRSRELRFLGVERGGRFTSMSGASRRRGGGFEPGPDARKAMTARGRSETRSGAAIHRDKSAGGGTANIHVGGKLKASISSSGPIQTGNGMQVKVGAYIRYAKFVEFPTIRTAAQPFLLPALHGQRETLPRLFASHLRRALGGR